jgi:hypothetical protein
MDQQACLKDVISWHGFKFGQGKSTPTLVPAGKKKRKKIVDDLQKNHPFSFMFLHVGVSLQ